MSKISSSVLIATVFTADAEAVVAVSGISDGTTELDSDGPDVDGTRGKGGRPMVPPAGGMPDAVVLIPGMLLLTLVGTADKGCCNINGSRKETCSDCGLGEAQLVGIC